MVPAKIAVEIANFAGFSQAGAPAMIRGSNIIAATDATNATVIKMHVATNDFPFFMLTMSTY
jgi:hypothetical protein